MLYQEKNSRLTSSSETRVFSLADVEAHNTLESCWVILHGNVYDVTKFLDDHPGGPDFILKNSGGAWILTHELTWAAMNASIAFDEQGHSDDAIELVKQYQIGILVLIFL